LLDPGVFATKFIDRSDETPVDGVDFTSVDGNLLCGVFANFSPGLPVDQPVFGGCAAMYYDYEFPRPADAHPEVGCQGFYLDATGATQIVCNNGAVFMGVSGGMDYLGNPSEPLGTVGAGQRLEVHGIVCEGLDDATVRCTNTTGNGFVLSRTEYSTF
jgi:hypothetical protein